MNVKSFLSPALAAVVAVAGSQTVLAMDDSQYSSWPAYDGSDLELLVDGTGTHFTLWSPKADAAEVLIYDSGRNTPAVDSLVMHRADGGTWRASVPEQLYGKFYTFRVTVGGKQLAETPGVWAKAVGTNGERAAIIDFARTNPAGWDSDRGPELRSITDAVIYEMHHRDFSMHPSSGIVHKGKFLALTEPQTRSVLGDKTGIDHLKELGITHVHILPSYDYNSVDESNLPSNQYNWGYDPFNYNAPEGSYSTDPANPATRVLEMKQMVKALHDAGIGVVMDVVYNHTANNDESNFSLTAPGYYYRHRADGSYSDASGCGNETASEREQMRNFIINSVKYWADEYHIDGFRFDLMAIHDMETMNKVAVELKKINPSIFIYGEGWTAGDSPLPAEQRALLLIALGTVDMGLPLLQGAHQLTQAVIAVAVMGMQHRPQPSHGAHQLGLGQSQLLLPAALAVDMLRHSALHLVGHGDSRQDQCVDGDKHHQHRQNAQHLRPAFILVLGAQIPFGFRNQIFCHSLAPPPFLQTSSSVHRPSDHAQHFKGPDTDHKLSHNLIVCHTAQGRVPGVHRYTAVVAHDKDL